MSTTRVCRICGAPKPLRSFEATTSGGRSRVCHGCRWKQKFENNPECARAKHRRWRANNPHSAILQDCRKSDQRCGREGFDLDRDFVREMISAGCRYCGDTTIRMTLDRIDNTKAHTRTNVVPACIRCNYIRGSMPYDAWLHLVPSIREARIMGLFGDWRTTPLNSNKTA